ncbi:MAG: cold shock domain-containing protein [Rhodocyclaceae bacterium]|nr:cold shock domain-containing protein [Rhodocyclaceae bacterium]
MQGKIVRWDEARGFGFVKEEITGTEIFIHISALNIRNPPPEVGEGVEFETAYNEQKGRTEVKQAAYRDKNRKAVLELAQAPRKSPARQRKHHADKNRPPRAQRNRRADYERRRAPKSNTWFWIVVAITIVAVIVGKFLQ